MKQMIQGIVSAPSLLAWAAVLSMASQSYATIIQSVHASYASPTGTVTFVDDSFVAPPDPLRNLSAEIGGTGFGASSSAGTFGNVGMEGHLLSRGSQQTSLTISSDEFINPSGVVPSRARASFIIDGGELTFLADGDLLFTLQLTANIKDRDGNAVDHSEWKSFAILSPGPTGTELTINGNDIGIEMIDENSARIPLSFQTFDIGIVPGGGSLSLSYHASVFGSAPQFVEIVSWRFSDPLSIDGPGEFPTVTYEPVPEPASGLLLLGGSLLGLLLRRRRSPESAIGCGC